MIQGILERGDRGESIRASLSGGGELHLDRSLPFLFVHRQPRDGADAGTDRLLRGEASFLLARAGEQEEAREVVRRVAESGSAEWGAFLVLELWSAASGESPAFVVRAPRTGPAPETVGKLVESLRDLGDPQLAVEVVVQEGDQRHPPGMEALLSVEQSWQGEILILGLAVPPLYRDDRTGEVYPRFLRRMRAALSRALRKTAYEFVRVQTTAEFSTHLALGTRSLPDTVWEIDRALVELERTFDPLLLITPINFDQAWSRFREGGHEHPPEFHYRLLPLDPDLLKRRLFAIEIEAVDDPALADLFQDKREELDTLLTMLSERGSPRFRYSSHRLYGTVDDTLLHTATELLASVPPTGPAAGAWIDASGFRQAAEAELAHYAATFPKLGDRVQIRRDVSGLMVSEGKLLIGETLRIREDRLEPLLQHEVGTHVLTYVNGSVQPLAQLSLGLADYDEWQEGLAVLAEYLVGGLDRLRMRLLAARVVAAHSVEQGAEFLETFRLLAGTYGYSHSGAWQIAMRVHASGGFTRDLIYLRGLIALLRHLEDGGDLRSLYLGKFAQKHIPIIDELRHREVLHEPPLTPRFLERPEAQARLDAARRGISLAEMI
jgi:uncharacterized protein (TIGR02421 family)